MSELGRNIGHSVGIQELLGSMRVSPPTLKLGLQNPQTPHTVVPLRLHCRFWLVVVSDLESSS